MGWCKAQILAKGKCDGGDLVFLDLASFVYFISNVGYVWWGVGGGGRVGFVHVKWVCELNFDGQNVCFASAIRVVRDTYYENPLSVGFLRNAMNPLYPLNVPCGVDRASKAATTTTIPKTIQTVLN